MIVKPRNPVIVNLHKYNKQKVVPNKKIELKRKRTKRVFDEYMEY